MNGELVAAITGTHTYLSALYGWTGSFGAAPSDNFEPRVVAIPDSSEPWGTPWAPWNWAGIYLSAIGLQHAGSYIETTVTNLQPGHKHSLFYHVAARAGNTASYTVSIGDLVHSETLTTPVLPPPSHYSLVPNTLEFTPTLAAMPLKFINTSVANQNLTILIAKIWITEKP
jgi:hypothetical protein